MDKRLERVGLELWREDDAGLRSALSETGVWPEGWSMAVFTAEELRMVVAMFVRGVRRDGWPRSADGLMAWCLENRVEGSWALTEERKRRDSKPRPGLLRAVGMEGAMRLPLEENTSPSFNEQMNELDRMKGKG